MRRNETGSSVASGRSVGGGLDYRHVDADVVMIGRRDILAADYGLLIDDLRRALRVVTKPKTRPAGARRSQDQAETPPLTSHQRRASRNTPMREENKNLILAIVLSVAVLIGWQYFFAPRPKPPQPQPIRPVNPAAPAAPSPSQAGGPAAPAPGTAAPAPAAPAAAPMAGNPRGGACPLAAGRDRHARDHGLDQPAGRPHRRRVAEELSRDRRPEEPEHRAVLAAGSQNALLRRVRLGRRRRPARAARTPTPSGPPTATDADRRAAGDPDLGQRPGPRLHAAARGRRQVHVHRARTRSRTRAGSRSTLIPYGLVSRHGKPHDARLLRPARGHDRRPRRPGPAGIHLRQARQGAARPAATHGQGLDDVTGGFARHHRQVLGGGGDPRSDATLSGQPSPSATDGTAKVYQASVLGDAARPSRPARAPSTTQRLFAGAKEVQRRRPLRDATTASRTSIC